MTQTSHEKSSAASPATASFKPEARSRVTNGKTLFLDRTDGRSRAARRFRDLLRAFLDKTGGRHADTCRALAAMCMERERLESKMAAGEVIDTDLLLRLASEIRRSQERVGLLEGEPAPELLPHDAPLWMIGERAPAPAPEEAA
ncbi:MAG: hypothetical protein GEU76_01145 [Alphaproteobacteria bacterium]|nr:hypothetical protein [Alphaproteobacteria bacterium]